MNAPKFRSDLDVIPTRYQGQRVLVVKDSLGLIAQPVLLQGKDLEFVRFLDGKTKVQDIQLYLMRQKGGLLVGTEEIQSLLDRFDALYLLDSERYRRAKADIIADFARQPVRRAFLAGRAYPDSKEALASYLDTILNQKDGEESLSDFQSLRALVAPHIDLEVGKKIYGCAYRAVRDKSPRKVFLFGTGHGLQNALVSLTEKDFETPLGVVKTDMDTVRKLRIAAGETAESGDFSHRSEHSIEFQTLFLRHLFGDGFLLVPVLFGSLHDSLREFSRPSQIPGLKDFLDALKGFLEEQESETLCLAGVDFSHIGPKFGHDRSATALIREAREHDEKLIASICAGDMEGFWDETRETSGYFNVCGFSALACLLEVLPRMRGRLLGYDFWEEEPTQSAVSFAALALGVQK